ncbi:hypothetical protein B0H12DRAFT_1091578 [Mycena haematopus]|nr:hypothetical protein B0H12DRAFT_1091578 [Mycena haematopus]
MTGAVTALRASHLVPEAEEEWSKYHYRILMGYGGDPTHDLNSIRNLIALRADLDRHRFADGPSFIFAPYAGRVVAVFTSDTAPDLAYEYHLRMVNFPSRIPRGYLFVNFAWCVFGFMSPGVGYAAAEVRGAGMHPHGAGFLRRNGGKRAAADSDAGGRGKRCRRLRDSDSEDADTEEHSDGEDGSAEYNDGEDSPLADHRESPPKAKAWEEDDDAQLAVYEILDAALGTRPLTVDDVQAGRYPGFSKMKRLARDYRRANPQVSAVGDPRVWEEGHLEGGEERGWEED